MREQQLMEASTVTLPSGRTVSIRPLQESDREVFLTFGGMLPEDDWLYLEQDLRSPEIVTRLVNASVAENWRQLVAFSDDEIVGYCAIQRLPGWSDHVGDIYLVVRKDWRRSGLGSTLARNIFATAQELGVSKLVVEMLGDHNDGRAIFKRLGFRVEGTLSDHARDRHGRHHDMLILAYHVPASLTTDT